VAGLERMVERQQGWLTGAADDLAQLTDTVDGVNAGAPRLGPVNPKIELKQSQLARIRADLKKSMEELEGARLNSTDTSKNVETLMGQRDGHMRDLAKFGDVDERDVAKLRDRHTSAVAEANAKHVEAAGDLNQRARAAQGELTKAEMEESLAATYRKNVAAQIDLRTALPPPGLARKVLHGSVELVSLPFLPILWMFEKGFGRVQSLPEAFEILIRGEKRVAELTRQLTMVERAVTQQRAEAHRLRGVLDQCVKQWSGAA
jgi:phosphatidate phosphatase PAH1